MIHLQLKYLAHISMITGVLEEHYQSGAMNFRELIEELDERHTGFRETFVDSETKQVRINAMIQYTPKGRIPSPVIDLDNPIEDGSIVTFW